MTHFGLPGTTAAIFNSESEILWGGDESKIEVIKMDAIISSASTDAGSTPTSVIRKGMILGKLTSTGEHTPWNPDAVDGTENIYGINGNELRVTDQYGTAADLFANMIVKAPVKAGSLKIEGTAMVGHVDEYLARRQLALMGFRLDDDPQNYLAGIVQRSSVKATNYTVLPTDNGTLFVAITADATFTLPTIQAGLEFEFLRASDHEIVVASVEGDNIVAGGDLSADSFTFTTAGQQIGARFRVKGIYLNSTLKWLIEVSVAPYSTGALMASAFAS